MRRIEHKSDGKEETVDGEAEPPEPVHGVDRGVNAQDVGRRSVRGRSKGKGKVLAAAVTLILPPFRNPFEKPVAPVAYQIWEFNDMGTE